MADRPRFGPAGMPPGFKALKLTVDGMPKYLRNEGLDAFEYQMVRWGPKPQIKREMAEQLGKNAIENDVWMTAHGSYFINLTAKGDVLEASKKRLLACVTGADWMGAHIVVFHPGTYAGRPPREAYETCEKAMKEVVESMKALGIRRRVHLAPETMGKPSQFGSLEEVLALCEQVDLTEPNIDWAHLHSRDRGRFKTMDDVRKVMDEIEKRLGTNALKNLHCHYSHIEFTDKGEKRHHNLDKTEYGPDFQSLAKLVAELDLKPVIACETPNLDVDAQKLRDMVLQEFKRKAKLAKLDSKMATMEYPRTKLRRRCDIC